MCVCVCVCVKMELQERKCLQNAQANHLFQSISGSKSISMCQMLGQTCGTRQCKKKMGLRGIIQRKDPNEVIIPEAWRESSCFQIGLLVRI